MRIQRDSLRNQTHEQSTASPSSLGLPSVKGGELRDIEKYESRWD